MTDLPTNLKMTEEHKQALLERVRDALLNGEPVYLEWDYRLGLKRAFFEARFKAPNGTKITIRINNVTLSKEDIPL